GTISKLHRVGRSNNKINAFKWSYHVIKLTFRFLQSPERSLCLSQLPLGRKRCIFQAYHTIFVCIYNLIAAQCSIKQTSHIIDYCRSCSTENS
ncbi:hypothetical protein T310_7430, partial [Rasamsonia emersonii CBS 393.64]